MCSAQLPPILREHTSLVVIAAMPLLALLWVKLQALSAEVGSQQALSAAAAAINAGDAHAALRPCWGRFASVLNHFSQNRGSLGIKLSFYLRAGAAMSRHGLSGSLEMME